MASEANNSTSTDKSAAAGENSFVPAVDVEAIMQRIRAQVAEDLAQRKVQTPKPATPCAQPNDTSSTKLVETQELKYLNRHWNTWLEDQPFSSHRPLIGKVLVKIKNFIRRYMRDVIFKDYLAAEREYHVQLLRHLNTAAWHIDRRDGEIFWDLVHKIDADVSAINERTDRLFSELADSLTALREKHEQRMHALELQASSLNAPAPSTGRVHPLEVPDYLPPVWQETLRRINENFARLAREPGDSK